MSGHGSQRSAAEGGQQNWSSLGSVGGQNNVQLPPEMMNAALQALWSQVTQQQTAGASGRGGVPIAVPAENRGGDERRRSRSRSREPRKEKDRHRRKANKDDDRRR